MKKSVARRKEIRFINQKLAERRAYVKATVLSASSPKVKITFNITGQTIRNQFFRHLRWKLRQPHHLQGDDPR